MPIPAIPLQAKALKYAKAVGAGYMDYSRKVKAINVAAEQKLQPKFGASQASDAQMLAKEIRQQKKEQNVSLRNSIRSKLNI